MPAPEISDPPVRPVPPGAGGADCRRPEDSVAPAARSLAASGRRHHWTFLILSTIVLALAIFLELGDGEKHVALGRTGVTLPGVCAWRNLTGVGCPGCGMTRCFISLAHGDILRAWRFNPAGFLAFGFLLFQFPYRAVQLRQIRHGRKELNLARIGHVFVWVLVAAIIAQWITRSIAGAIWQ